MIVIAEGELKELLMTGKSRKYKRITNNKDLYNGLRILMICKQPVFFIMRN